MTRPFTEYLMALHFNENPMLKDDDIPDHYDEWVSRQDLEDLGNKYINHMSKTITNQVLRELT